MVHIEVRTLYDQIRHSRFVIPWVISTIEPSRCALPQAIATALATPVLSQEWIHRFFLELHQFEAVSVMAYPTGPFYLSRRQKPWLGQARLRLLQPTVTFGPVNPDTLRVVGMSQEKLWWKWSQPWRWNQQQPWRWGNPHIIGNYSKAKVSMSMIIIHRKGSMRQIST